MSITIKSFWREPLLTWGFRLACSVCPPLLYGVLTSQITHVFWIAIASQSIALIELKGNLGLILRQLFSAIVISVSSCILGSISGNIFIIHILMMFVVGFTASLFKNLGERGMGMALSVYLFYIIASSYPVENIGILIDRCSMVIYGGLWTFFVAMLFVLFRKQGSQYRRSVADVFLRISDLCKNSRSGFGAEGEFISDKDLFEKETKIREALNVSVSLFGVVSQSSQKEVEAKNRLEKIRTSSSLINVYLTELVGISNYLKSKISFGQVDVNVHSLLRVWEQIFQLTANYMLSLKEEDKILLISRLERLDGIAQILKQDQRDKEINAYFRQMLLLSRRMERQINSVIQILSSNHEKRIYKSYSLPKTLSILHPKQFSNEFSNLFKVDKGTLYYAIRVGIATSIGVFIGHYFYPSFGYWIPFTSIIVAQPYIGATVERGIQRSLGTLLGVLIGYIIFQLPYAQIWNILVVFICSVLMIWFLRKNYSIASIFITIAFLGILSLNHEHDANLLIERLICTVIGASVSILIGFLFIPVWEESMLPKHFDEALKASYDYFLHSPLIHSEVVFWLHYKRTAESANATLFNSYSRWLSEPKPNRNKDLIAHYFMLITHLIRITKELNNLHADFDLNRPSEKEVQNLELYKDADGLFRSCFMKRKLPYQNVNSYQKFQCDYSLNRAEKIYLEKIIFELRALNNSLETIITIRGREKIYSLDKV